MAFASFGRSALLALSLASVGAPAQAAEIAWLMSNCEGGKLCPWWQVKLAPPKGWKIDENFGKARKSSVLMLANNAAADPLIYVNTSYNGAKDNLDARIARSEADWRERQPDVQIERLPDLARASGEAPFRLYRYRNPSNPRQPLEYVGWAEHVDAKGNRFVFIAGLSHANEQVIEREKAAFLQVLKGL